MMIAYTPSAFFWSWNDTDYLMCPPRRYNVTTIVYSSVVVLVGASFSFCFCVVLIYLYTTTSVAENNTQLNMQTPRIKTRPRNSHCRQREDNQLPQDLGMIIGLRLSHQCISAAYLSCGALPTSELAPVLVRSSVGSGTTQSVSSRLIGFLCL